jgi:hypothetical protein
MRSFAFLLSTVLVLSGVLVSPVPAVAAQNPNLITNGGFETVTGGGFTNGVAIAQTRVTGWSTTETDLDIELWASGFQPGTPGTIVFRSAGVSDGSGNGAIGGVDFAEINANFSGAALYQNVATTPGSLYQWSFIHRGRSGIDTAQMLLGNPSSVYTAAGGSNPVPAGTTDAAQMVGMLPPATYAQPAFGSYDALNGSTYTYLTTGANNVDTSTLIAGSAGATLLTAKNGASGYLAGNWTEHLGYYTVPVGQTTTSYQLYAAASASASKAMGNLVDNVTFVKIAEPVTETVLATTPSLPSGSSMIDSLQDGFTNTAPNPTVPKDASGNYTPGSYPVTETIKDGQGNPVGTVTSTLVVQPVVTVQYQLADGTVLTGLPTGVQKTTPMTCPSAVSYSGTYTEPDYTAGDTITIDGVVYQFVALASDSAPTSQTTGTTTNATVKYVLEAVTPAVTTHYVDAGGQPLINPTSQAYDQGDPYATTAPSEITTAGVTYVKTLANPANATGMVGTDDIEVTYIYSPKPLTVTSKFVDASGKELQVPVIASSQSGEAYQTSAPPTITINGVTYKLTAVPSNATGDLGADNVVVTYVYEPIMPVDDPSGTPTAIPNLPTPKKGTPASLPLTGDTFRGITFITVILVAGFALATLRRRLAGEGR